MAQLTAENMEDLVLEATRLESDPKVIRIDAYLGDLYLGFRDYRGGTVKNAKKSATSYIKYNGSLN